MRLAIRLLIAGPACVVIGLLWLATGLAGGSEIFTGGTWKGPLLAVTGAAATVMGIRMLRAPDVPQENDRDDKAV
jgi:hypothetical protein